MRVMAYQHDGAPKAVERLYEGFPSINVEMVGRLVQQKHVRFAGCDRRKHKARLLTARQVSNSRVGFGLFQAE